ncbi:MAG TPA: hypothetical protein VK864_07315, partial [Longimicrobiales bacterium]|nr:hypothetical protein [Longimicrobiales bacterium]
NWTFLKRTPTAGPMNHDEWFSTLPVSAPTSNTLPIGTHALTARIAAELPASANDESTDIPER